MKTGKGNTDHCEENKTIDQEAILKITKEIAVKFIEMGRITPNTFDETFKNINKTIRETVDKG